VSSSTGTPVAEPVATTSTDRRDRRRAELVAAAIEVIRRDGPTASMDAMAAESGVTKPIIYRHFGDRSGLIENMAVAFVGDLVEDVSAQLRTDEPAQVVIRQTIDAYVGHIEADAQLYRFLIQEAPQGGIHFLAALIAEEVAKVLTQFLPDDAESASTEAWAYGLVGMVHFAADWWAYRQSMSRADLVDHLTRLALSGLNGLGIGP
jgi:AcrR family transcriptional regulator